MGVYKQGPGVFTLAATDYAAEVTRVEPVFETTTETIPAVLSTGEEDEDGGAKKRYLEIDVLGQGDADGLRAELLAAFESSTQELAFAFRENTGAISADNPEYQGTIRVTAIGVGGKVGKIREKTYRYPIKAGTWVIDVTA